MGRHSKRGVAPLSDEAAAVAVEFARTAKASQALLARSLGHLDRLQAAVEKALASGEASSALVRESASVSRAIAAMSAEIRASEKHDHLMTMTPEQQWEAIREYLRGVPRLEREQITRELVAMNDDGTLLG